MYRVERWHSLISTIHHACHGKEPTEAPVVWSRKIRLKLENYCELKWTFVKRNVIYGDMRNCMRMIFFFLFRVVHRNQLGKKKPTLPETKQLCLFTSWLLSCSALARLNQFIGKCYFLLLWTAVRDAQPLPAQERLTRQRRPPKNASAFPLTPRKWYKPQNYPVCQVKDYY